MSKQMNILKAQWRNISEVKYTFADQHKGQEHEEIKDNLKFHGLVSQLDDKPLIKISKIRVRIGIWECKEIIAKW